MLILGAPLLTADHRVLLEFADDIIYGLKAVLKTVDAQKGIIVIEDNKPDAIALMEEKGFPDCDNIEVVTAKTKYPQGAEKTLIKRVMGRTVPKGELQMWELSATSVPLRLFLMRSVQECR